MSCGGRCESGWLWLPCGGVYQLGFHALCMMGDEGIGCVWQGAVGDSRVRAGWQGKGMVGCWLESVVLW